MKIEQARIAAQLRADRNGVNYIIVQSGNGQWMVATEDYYKKRPIEMANRKIEVVKPTIEGG